MSVLTGNLRIDDAGELEDISNHAVVLLGIGTDADSGILTTGDGILWYIDSEGDLLGLVWLHDAGRLVNGNPFGDFVAIRGGLEVSGVILAYDSVRRDRYLIM